MKKSYLETKISPIKGGLFIEIAVRKGVSPLRKWVDSGEGRLEGKLLFSPGLRQQGEKCRSERGTPRQLRGKNSVGSTTPQLSPTAEPTGRYLVQYKM